jgi:hypothetical protein
MKHLHEFIALVETVIVRDLTNEEVEKVLEICKENAEAGMSHYLVLTFAWPELVDQSANERAINALKTLAGRAQPFLARSLQVEKAQLGVQDWNDVAQNSPTQKAWEHHRSAIVEQMLSAFNPQYQDTIRERYCNGAYKKK